jgi:perosamine synthetase|tara:strand:- start:123 stop:1211 length:1089 start_codon:yes stop_codon:yes gene_type:complete
MVKKIKLFDPVIGKDEEKSVIKVLKSKFWASGAGVGNVKKFEDKFKQFVKADQCIAVNSGTAALNLSLSLIDVKNCEVILPSLSFVSTANAIIINGGKPVFVDIDKKTLNIDPEKIQNAITKKTKAIIPVHFGGLSCNLQKINSLAKKYNLKIIEDAAHAVGSMYNNKNIGSNGFAVCFSFHPAKNLAMPVGGIIAINHKQHKRSTELLKAKRWCGITNRINSDYEVKEIGNNYYMNEFSAAIGLVQLNKLRKLNKIRKSIAKKYSEEIQLDAKMPYDNNCSYHLYWILVKNRNELRQIMVNSGIETGIHYKPIHSFKYYKNGTSLPITEIIGKQIVTIPIHPNLKNNEINRIINLVNKFAK